MATATQISKSNTIRFAGLLAILSTIAASMEQLTPYFGEYGGLVGVLVSAIIAGLRAITVEPLDNK